MRSTGTALLLCATFSLLLPVCDVAAQTASAQRQNLHERNRAAQPAFTNRDEKIIREYFASYPGESTDASIENAGQPPVKGQRLRPGIPTRPLPRDLAIRLKPLPKGYERLIVGNDILIVANQGDVVVDTILDAW